MLEAWQVRASIEYGLDIEGPLTYQLLRERCGGTPNQVKYALRMLREDGLIEVHVLTKAEAQERGLEWRPKQYVVALVN